MNEQISIKLDNEIREYRQRMMLSSKESLYVSSNEIAGRRRIYEILKELIFSSEQEKRLIREANLIDKIFLICSERKAEEYGEIRNIIEDFSNGWC